MKILVFSLLIVSLISQSFGGVLYHRQHAAAVEAGHSLTRSGGDNYFGGGNQIYGGGFGFDGGDESVRIIKITRTYAVPVPVPIPYPKEVPVPVPVPKPIPVPVPHPVPVPVHKTVVIPHPVAVGLPIDHLSPPSNEESHYQDLRDYSHSSSSGPGYSQSDYSQDYAQQGSNNHYTHQHHGHQ